MKLLVKLVPDAEPNAPGEWKAFEVATETFPMVWSEAARLLCDRIPRGYHMVNYDRAEAA